MARMDAGGDRLFPTDSDETEDDSGSSTENETEEQAPSVPDPTDQPARGNDPSSGSGRGSGGTGGVDPDPEPSDPTDQPARGNDPSSGTGRGSGDPNQEQSPTDQPARGNDPSSGEGRGSGDPEPPTEPTVPPDMDQPARGNDPSQRPQPDELKVIDPADQTDGLAEGQGAEEGPGSFPTGRTSLKDDLSPEQLERLQSKGYDSLDRSTRREIQRQVDRGAEKLGVSRDEISATIVGGELLIFAGDEPSQDDIRKTVAADIESEFVSNSQYEKEDVAVTFNDGTATVQMTRPAAANELADRYRDMEEVPDDAVVVTADNEVIVNMDEVEPKNADLARSQSMDQQVAMANREIAKERQQPQPAPDSGGREGAVKAKLRDQYPNAESIEVGATEDGKYEFKVTKEQTRPRQEPTTREITGTFEPKQTEEQFGDFDWSFGMGGPGDEVERTIDNAADAVQKKGTQAANALFEEDEGVASKSGGAVVLRAIGRPDLARTYEESLRGFGKGTVEGTAAIANVPGMLGGVMEGAETIGYAGKKTAEGEGEEFVGQSVKRGSQIAEEMWSNKAQSAGLLVGSLAGSFGVMNAAGRVSRRAGLASRLAIQPGEEAAGYGGYYLTRRAASARTAERLFPQKEPLIFSEEAAIMAARRASGKAKRAARYSKLSFEEFAGSTRGTAQMPKFEFETEDTEPTVITGEDLDVERKPTEPSSSLEFDRDSGDLSAREMRSKRRELQREAERREVTEGRLGDERPVPQETGRLGDPIRKPDARTETEAQRLRERAQQLEVEAETEPQSKLEAARRAYETTLVSEPTAAQLQKQATKQEAAVDTEQKAVSREELAMDVEPVQRAEARVDTESLVETEVDTEVRAEAETDVETDQEVDQEVEAELRAEFEIETEADLETELEPPREVEAESDAEDSGEQIFDFGDSAGESDSATGPVTLDAGWINKYATALAGGGLAAREVAEDAEEGPLPAPTVAQEEGGEDIEAVESFFNFEGFGDDEGGDWL